MKRGWRGLTVIELLFLVAIIAVLAALVIPFSMRARTKARCFTCLSATKQITLGLIMYAKDYDGRWVGPTARADWTAKVMPYIKNEQVFRCPERTTDSVYGTSCEHCGVTHADLGIRFFACDYMLNGVRDPETGAIEGIAWAREEQVEHPSSFAAVVDGRRSWLHFYQWAYGNDEDGRNCDPSIADMHRGGANIGFFDGHAKWFEVPTSPPQPGTDFYNMWNING